MRARWPPRYLYGPAELPVPQPTDPVLAVTLSPQSAGLLIGEPIEIGGADAAIVDQQAAGTNVDLELAFGEHTVDFVGLANLAIDELIIVAEQDLASTLALSGNATPPSVLGPDLHQRFVQETGVWSAENVNGQLTGTSMIYADPDGNDGLRLQISTINGGLQALERTVWRYSTAVDVSADVGFEALLAEPIEGLVVVRLVTDDGQAIELKSSGIALEELLAAATSLQPAE